MKEKFMNDYSHKGGIRIHAIKYLSELGLPCGNIYKSRIFVKLHPNKWNQANIKFMVEDDQVPVKIYRTKIFSVPLRKLRKRQVVLTTGQLLPVPKVVQELCESILENVDTEGIFRKRGSRSKQARIKAKIDERGHLSGNRLNVIDLAAVLRYFLRTLPEPLIPYAYHNLFLACCNLRNKKEVLLIATLLLPIDHLNLLTYLMQFFKAVTTFSEYNKMSSYKLAVCIADDIIPVCKFSRGIFDKTTEVTRLLIKESYAIGFITSGIQKKLDLEGTPEFKKSNPLVRLLNDIKKFLLDVI